MTPLLRRVEAVEWRYDGLGGKIIKWTMEQGSPKDHPSVLMFLVGPNGKAVGLLDKGGQYNAGSSAKWLNEKLTEYERAHPRTRVPLTRTEVAESGEGEDKTFECEAFDKARKAGAPTLLYFGRDSHGPKDKTGKREAKKCRSFEKSTLGSKKAQGESDGWTLLRFDMADGAHAGFAKAHGVTVAPAMLMWTRGADKPTVIKRTTTGGSLAFLLKKGKVEVAPAKDKQPEKATAK